MKARLHTLKAEIKAIENVIDTLSGNMLTHATEELKNLRFEMDMLNRNIQKANNAPPPLVERLEEELSH
jgi:hypothetical protein